MNKPDIWPPEPPRHRKPRSGRKGLQLLLGIVVIGAVGYFLYADMLQRRMDDGPGIDRTPRGSLEPAETAVESGRTDQILTCKADDGSTFYTNATSCDAADLENRVNVVSSRPADTGMGQNCLGTQEEKAVSMFHSDCQVEFNKALELERYLAAADDPASSRRAQEYCDLIAQGVANGCMATSQTFCYLQICQQRQESNQ